mgnify:CR=1 FL=1
MHIYKYAHMLPRLPHVQVGRLAAMHGLHLRTGCFCNPGACGHWLRLSAEDMIRHHRWGAIKGRQGRGVVGTSPN